MGSSQGPDQVKKDLAYGNCRQAAELICRPMVIQTWRRQENFCSISACILPRKRRVASTSGDTDLISTFTYARSPTNLNFAVDVLRRNRWRIWKLHKRNSAEK